jgi:hypothetical protein
MGSLQASSDELVADLAAARMPHHRRASVAFVLVTPDWMPWASESSRRSFPVSSECQEHVVAAQPGGAIFAGTVGAGDREESVGRIDAHSAQAASDIGALHPLTSIMGRRTRPKRTMTSAVAVHAIRA